MPEAWRRPTPQQAVAGARTVLWRLPRAVGAVEEYAELIAMHADPGVQVVAAERDKQLSRSMNTALAKSFESVAASLGHRKARALIASDPRSLQPSWPRRTHLDALDLDVTAHGATFSTNRLDRGTALLVSCLDRLPAASTAMPSPVAPPPMTRKSHTRSPSRAASISSRLMAAPSREPGPSP